MKLFKQKFDSKKKIEGLQILIIKMFTEKKEKDFNKKKAKTGETFQILQMETLRNQMFTKQIQF